MSNGAAEKMITLRSSDDEEFTMTEAEAKVSKTISHMIEDNCTQTAIPLPNVTAGTLAKVIQYCKKHVSDLDTASPYGSTKPQSDKEMGDWDSEFIRVDEKTLYDLILAANYLDIKGMLDLACKNVANQMRGKTPEAIRAHFHIVNDYTPEEEAQIRQELSWAFE